MPAYGDGATPLITSLIATPSSGCWGRTPNQLSACRCDVHRAHDARVRAGANTGTEEGNRDSDRLRLHRTVLARHLVGEHVSVLGHRQHQPANVWRQIALPSIGIVVARRCRGTNVPNESMNAPSHRSSRNM